MCPVPLVCQLSPLVVELSPPMHLVLLPFSVIIASVLIEEFSSAVPEAIFLKTLVLTPCLVLLDDKLNIIVFVIWLLGLVWRLLVDLDDRRIVFIRVPSSRRRGHLNRRRRFGHILLVYWLRRRLQVHQCLILFVLSCRKRLRVIIFVDLIIADLRTRGYNLRLDLWLLSKILRLIRNG